MLAEYYTNHEMPLESIDDYSLTQQEIDIKAGWVVIRYMQTAKGCTLLFRRELSEERPAIAGLKADYWFI